MKDADTKRKKNTMRSEIWIRLKRNKTAMFGLFLLLLVILGALLAGVVAPEGYDAQNLRDRFIAPNASHIFGTDQYGRDIFARVLYGARISLSIGFSAVILSVTVGTIIGAYAAYYGKHVDNILMRFIDIWMAIPNILLAISVMAALGASINNLVIAIAIGAIPGHARIVRSAVLSVKNQEFIEAAVSNGASDFRIITRYILPNCLAPIIVQATMSVAKAILSASSLSFIGLGVQQPVPEWGAMLSVGRTYIRDYPWIITFPGIAIMTTIYGINLFGDGLRDALDPRLKH